jgi:hypothetical protein
MKNVITIERLLTGAAIAAALSSAAYAQADGRQGASRADVQAEARAANTAGQIPAGEESDRPKPMHSAKTRAERKAETLEANKNGGLGSPGASSYRSNNIAPREATRNSTVTRADRKAATMQAVKDGRMLPAGEAEANRN